MKNSADMIHVVSSETIEVSSEKMWPTIASRQIKHRCLNEFRKAMSNDAVDQRVCAVCACLHYKAENLEINIATIPNQHLLYPGDVMHPCVHRFNVDMDSNSGNLLTSG